MALATLVVAGLIAAVLLDPRGADRDTAGADPTASAADPTEPEGAADEPDGTATDENLEPTDPGGGGPSPDDPVESEDAIAPGEAPPGYDLYTDASYRVAVPEGWSVENGGDGVTTYFKDPASRRYLLVAEGGEPAGDPVDDWRAQEEARAPTYSDYELIGIDYADYRDFLAADWEFKWNPGDGMVRVRNRAVVDQEKNLAFALYWHVPVEEWKQSRAMFEDIAASFQVRG